MIAAKSLLLHENEIMRTFALLCYHYNSFHEQNYTARNLLDGEEKSLNGICQFVPPSKKRPERNIEIGHWQIGVEDLFKHFPDLAEYTIYSQDSGTLDFYFPLVLGPEYNNLLNQLGPPLTVLNGILSTSGRSIWVFGGLSGPFCLKIDTLQLNERRGFSERALLESGLRYSASLSRELRKKDNIFEEEEGLHLVFDFLYNDKKKRYTYLVRRLNFERVGIQPTDVLLPVSTLMSQAFWENKELVSSLGLPADGPVELLKNEFAPLFAKLIREAIETTFFHYEIHQQNLTLVIRNGHAVKLLYYDLEDSLFDPVSYFLQRVLESGWENCGSILKKIQQLKRSDAVDDQGFLIRESLDNIYNGVTSFYRRYFRNFGMFTRSFNLFSGQDYIASREFETVVLNHLNFSRHELDLETESYPLLEGELFWNIDRYHRTQQRRNLVRAMKNYEVSSKVSEAMTVTELLNLISEGIVFVSVDLPVHFERIKPEYFKNIRNLHDRKIFYAEYNDLPVLILKQRSLALR